MSKNTIFRILMAFVVAVATIFSLLIVNPGNVANAATGGSTLVTQDFTKDSAADNRWVVPNQEDGTDSSKTNAACLTAASSTTPQPGAGSSSLWYCRHTTGSHDLNGKTDGFLQLTDASGGETGSVLYNRALPTSAGLDVSFYQYQYGGNGADGIGFYLTDGSYDLSTVGPTGSGFGGALGYGSITEYYFNDGNTAQWKDGIAHGVLGVGLDRYGNFSRQGYVGVNCAGQPDTNNRAPDSVTLRGAGNGTDGYCVLATEKLSDSGKTLGTDAPVPGGKGQNNGKLVRVVISPVTEADPHPTVTVYFDGSEIESYTMATALPPTVKFGLTASTGGSTDVHLVRSVRVSSVNPMGAIRLVKTVNHDVTNGVTEHTVFTAGDDIPYSFLVTNTGGSTLNGVSVTDPKVSNIDCPASTLKPADSMVCTGTYSKVTETEEQTGAVTNTASATGTPEDTGTPVDSNPSTAKVATYSRKMAALTKVVDGSGSSAAAGKTFTVNYSYPAGNYQYCDEKSQSNPSSGTSGLSDMPRQFPGATGVMTVEGGKSATSDPIPVGAVVTLSEPDSGVPGTTWTPEFAPSNTVTIGCSAESNSNAVKLTNTYVAETGSVSWSSWSKTDGSGALLAGSQWTLTGPDRKSVTVVDNGENDADPAVGTLKVTGLAWGEYSLVESKAPAGYVADLKPQSFDVKADALTLDLGKIVNKQRTPPTLPLTGGMSTDAFVLGGVTLMMLSAGLAVALRRRMHTRV